MAPRARRYCNNEAIKQKTTQEDTKMTNTLDITTLEKVTGGESAIEQLKTLFVSPVPAIEVNKANADDEDTEMNVWLWHA